MLSKKTARKPVNLSTDVNELSTERDWTDMLDTESLSLFPGRDELRKRLSYTLLKWSGQPGSLDIGQFCIKYRISYFTLKEWVDKYPDLAKVYATAKYNIGTNRRVGVFRKDTKGSFVIKICITLTPILIM